MSNTKSGSNKDWQRRVRKALKPYSVAVQDLATDGLQITIHDCEHNYLAVTCFPENEPEEISAYVAKTLNEFRYRTCECGSSE